MNRRIPENTWAEIRTAYASGLGLRELARRLDVPAGTVLARSRREGWTAQIQQARNIVPVSAASNAPVADAVANIIAEHGEACRAASLRASRKGLEHLAESDAEAIIARSRDLKSLTESAAMAAGDWRRDQPSTGGTVNVALIHMELD